MPLTVQKLQLRIAELGKAAIGSGVAVSPLFVAPAAGPMAPLETIDESLWGELAPGQTWGAAYSTCWLKAILQMPATESGHSKILRLHWETTPRNAFSPWDTGPRDALLLQLEATAFLDGKALGGFDSRHPLLVLPEGACDDQPHMLAIQVYTRLAAPFGGLTLHVRNERIWQLYHLMHTLLEAHRALNEQASVRPALLADLNAAYATLDLREGWQSERLARSASVALDNLRAWIKKDQPGGGRPHIVVNGHAHLDLGWLWPYWRTRQKVAHTLSNVLGLMERYPWYRYSQSQPQLLQWLKEDAPDLYVRVKECILEGRIEPVGAMWVEADCNLPSGESLIRQIMHGTRFLQQEFDITPRLIWLPDAFGYNAALPQIMRGCAIPTFMSTKLSWNQFNRMPHDTFRWRGIDGSEVLVHFITAPDVHEDAKYYTYNGPLQPGDIIGTWLNYREQSINDRLLYLCGWGDGGGGPTEEQLERVQLMADLPGFPAVSMGSVAEYFADLYERVWKQPRLPTWVGELYLELHRGTFTSQARSKQSNRQAEFLYREAELLNGWASLYGMSSRQTLLNEGWRRILLNQFHDVLPGSSIPEVYADAQRIYEEARAIGEQVCTEALATLSARLGGGEMLLNTLPWERIDPLQLQTSLLGGQRTTDLSGKSVWLVDGIRLPSCGMMSLTETGVQQQEHGCHALSTETGLVTLHNEYYELVFDEFGEIKRLYDKKEEREVFKSGQAGNQLIAYEDRPLNFDAWDIDLYYDEKPYPVREMERIQILEDGPIRTTVEVVRRFLSSSIKQRISLWRSSPRIDFVTEIDWHEHQILLKAAFPLAINSTRATYEIQFGCIERPTHRNTSWEMAQFEVCAHRWVDFSEGGYGVSLLNDGKYGHDIHDSLMRLTLLKSGILPDPNADQGLHRFTYSLLPHRGDWREARTVRHAYELNVPVRYFSGQDSSSPDREDLHFVYSFLRTDCLHIVIETVKPAENGDGLIVRFYEAHNQRGHGTIIFTTAILSAHTCNLLEETVDDAVYQKNRLLFQVRPFEIKTFRVRLAPIDQ